MSKAENVYREFTEIFQKSKEEKNGWKISCTDEMLLILQKQNNGGEKACIYLPLRPNGIAVNGLGELFDELDRLTGLQTKEFLWEANISRTGHFAASAFKYDLYHFSGAMRSVYAQGILEKFLEPAEELGWTCYFYAEPGDLIAPYRTGVELRTGSPLGEDFGMDIDYGMEDPIISFMEELEDYHNKFKPDEHADMWFQNRHVPGTPQNMEELLEDAEAIRKMIRDLYLTLSDGEPNGLNVQGRSVLVSTEFLFDKTGPYRGDHGLYTVVIPETCSNAELEQAILDAHKFLGGEDRNGENRYGEYGQTAETLLTYVCNIHPSWSFTEATPDLTIVCA